MTVLDSNVISEIMLHRPDRSVTKWLDARPWESFWTTSVTIYEIRFGIASMPKGKRRRELQEEFELFLQEQIEDRVFPFDTPAAEEAALIGAGIRSQGRSIEMRDLQIAAITKWRQATLATCNTKHFENTGVALVNPWEA